MTVVLFVGLKLLWSLEPKRNQRHVRVTLALCTSLHLRFRSYSYHRPLRWPPRSTGASKKQPGEATEGSAACIRRCREPHDDQNQSHCAHPSILTTRESRRCDLGGKRCSARQGSSRSGACQTISVRPPAPAVRGNLLLIPRLLVEISLRAMTMTARIRPSSKSKSNRFSALCSRVWYELPPGLLRPIWLISPSGRLSPRSAMASARQERLRPW